MPNIETTAELWKFIGDNIQSRNIHDDENCERDKGSDDKAKRLECRCVDRFRVGLPDRYAKALKADDMLEKLAELESEATEDEQMIFEIEGGQQGDDSTVESEAKDTPN